MIRLGSLTDLDPSQNIQATPLTAIVAVVVVFDVVSMQLELNNDIMFPTLILYAA